MIFFAQLGIAPYWHNGCTCKLPSQCAEYLAITGYLFVISHFVSHLTGHLFHGKYSNRAQYFTTFTMVVTYGQNTQHTSWHQEETTVVSLHSYIVMRFMIFKMHCNAQLIALLLGPHSMESSWYSRYTSQFKAWKHQKSTLGKLCPQHLVKFQLAQTIHSFVSRTGNSEHSFLSLTVLEENHHNSVVRD